MATDILPDVTDPGKLSEILRRSGVLSDGLVCGVTVESSRPTLLSRIIRLRLAYDGGGAGAPGTLILKTGLPERAAVVWAPGRREVAFYSTIAGTMPAGIVPRCFDAAWDEHTGDWHLLLEDLTDTHVIVSTWPLPPSVEHCGLLLDARARCHAAWWDDPRLGTIMAEQDVSVAERYMRDLPTHFAHFADLLGDRLTPERRMLCERVIIAAPRLLERHRSGRNLTITHGDAHVWNAFLPRDPRDGVRLFDWDVWGVGIASGDLSYMMAVHWYPDRRRRLEGPLLDRYHTELLAHGVSGYERSDLDDDYRRSVLLQTMLPVRQAVNDLPPAIWWSHLERIMLAVDDLGCRELLE